MKGLFSFRLFRDGLSRNKSFGIISLCFVTVLALCRYLIFPPETATQGCIIYQKNTWSVFLMPLVLPLAPIAVYLQFKFLNRRESSDSLFSLPYTKVQLCTSFFAAAAVWMLVAILLPLTVAAAVGCFIQPESAPSLISYFLLDALRHFGGMLLLMCFMLLAMALCGRALSDFVLFLTLAFFPRSMLFLVKDFFAGALPNLSLPSAIERFISPDFYLPVNCLTDLEYGGFDLAALVYGYILSLLLFALSLLLFSRRNAETAGSFAATAGLRSILPILFVLPLCISSLNRFIPMLTPSASADPFGGTLFLLLAIALLFFCDFAAKKDGFSLKGTSLKLLTVLIISLCFSGGLQLYKNYELSFEPKAEEIKSIRLIDIGRTVNHPTVYPFYEDLLLLEFPLEGNSEANAIISSALKSTNSAVLNGSFNKNSYDCITVEITTDSDSRTRILKMEDNTSESLYACFTSDEMYTDRILDLPDDSLIQKIYVSGNCLPYLSENTEALYECFKKEYASLTREQKLLIKTDSSSFSVCNIQLFGKSAGETFCSIYSVPDFMEETQKLIFRSFDAEKKHSEFDAVLKEAFEGDEPRIIEISVSGVSPVTREETEYVSLTYAPQDTDYEENGTNKKLIDGLLALAEKNRDLSLRPDAPYFCISLSYFSNLESGYGGDFFALSQDDFTQLQTLLAEYNG